jgi:hypothetical protein
MVALFAFTCYIDGIQQKIKRKIELREDYYRRRNDEVVDATWVASRDRTHTQQKKRIHARKGTGLKPPTPNKKKKISNRRKCTQ